MSITDELREAMMLMPCISDDWLTIPKSEFGTLADRIDAEHSVKVERLEKYRAAVDAMLKEYVKLPVDADGVPIHVGDEVAWGDGEAFEVMGFGGICMERAFYLNEGGRFCWGIAENCHHVQPDSWERIMDDAEKLARGDNAAVMELIERCRRLAGEGA